MRKMTRYRRIHWLRLFWALPYFVMALAGPLAHNHGLAGAAAAYTAGGGSPNLLATTPAAEGGDESTCAACMFANAPAVFSTPCLPPAQVASIERSPVFGFQL